MNPDMPVTGGTTFGLPWAKGTLDRYTPLHVADASGAPIPSQHSPRAYWPDGSVKWTLHSAALPQECGSCTVSDGVPPPPPLPVTVTETEQHITVHTGTMVCTVAKECETLFTKITRPNGKVLCSGGRLVALNEQRHGYTGGYASVTTVEPFYGAAYYCTVEESGPVRAVVRLRGSHIGQNTGMRTTSQFRKWLTFDLRLYFYAGRDDIRMVHTFIFDGREEEDFIRGLGMEFDVPMSSAPFNRYVRFGGESGLFAESPKSLWNRRNRNYDNFYADQLDGKEVLFDAQMLLNDMTEWNDFKQVQLSSEEYVVSKRTGENCVYVRGANGRRALGIAYAGGSQNGLALFQRDFWQKHPSSFEACNMLADTATLKTWFWSPDAPPMDLRRYDSKTHVDACYEGFEEMRSTAYGIANTNETVLCCHDAFPGSQTLIENARAWQSPNLLLAPVDYYITTNVFGPSYDAADRSTPGRAKVEDMLDAQLAFYINEREQSKWYGFWDYGDIRHAYDAIRHSWRYDMGGFAWQNTELVPNLWLWFGFLRSQRQDYFRFAEAMTRHTSEVDLYHLGEYKLLGTRHNVVHWGCGCKEARVGLCLMHKPYYFLTGDERVGDIMDEERDVDYALWRLPPMRAYFTPDPRHPTHIRWGPDIIALLEIWLTRWERFEDAEYRDKIIKMLSHFRGPGDFADATIWGYDPKNGAMTCVERKPGTHFNHCFGTAYTLAEVLSVLEDEHLWEQFADMGQAKKGSMAIYFTGVAALAAKARGDKELAAEVWDTLLNTQGKHDHMQVPIETVEIDSPRVHKVIREAATVSGNSASQWGSNVIVALTAIGDWL